MRTMATVPGIKTVPNRGDTLSQISDSKFPLQKKSNIAFDKFDAIMKFK